MRSGLLSTLTTKSFLSNWRTTDGVKALLCSRGLLSLRCSRWSIEVSVPSGFSDEPYQMESDRTHCRVITEHELPEERVQKQVLGSKHVPFLKFNFWVPTLAEIFPHQKSQ